MCLVETDAVPSLSVCSHGGVRVIDLPSELWSQIIARECLSDLENGNRDEISECNFLGTAPPDSDSRLRHRNHSLGSGSVPLSSPDGRVTQRSAAGGREEGNSDEHLLGCITEFTAALISSYGRTGCNISGLLLSDIGFSDWRAIQEQHPSGLSSWMAVMKWNADEFYLES